jgi:hypothetical protein
MTSLTSKDQTFLISFHNCTIQINVIEHKSVYDLSPAVITRGVVRMAQQKYGQISYTS